MQLNFRQWVGALVLLGILLVGVGIIVSGKPPEPLPEPLSASVAAFSGEAFACTHGWGCTTPAIAGQKVYTDGLAFTAPSAVSNVAHSMMTPSAFSPSMRTIRTVVVITDTPSTTSMAPPAVGREVPFSER